jgi:hypothetical protein
MLVNPDMLKKMIFIFTVGLQLSDRSPVTLGVYPAQPESGHGYRRPMAADPLK